MTESNPLRPKGDTQVLASVTNAARLLKEFGRGDHEIGVTELSRRLGIGKSTTHRLLHTLTHERLLEQDPETGAYRLGLAMHELGASARAHHDLHQAASPVLDQLRNITRETVQVAVLDGREVVYVERRESPQTLRLFGRVGLRNYAHCTSTGKAMLAFLPEDELELLLTDWKPPRRTQYTITDIAVLRRELMKVRAQGWAENINESEVGIASVAAPVRNVFGQVVASVSVAGPIQRLDGASLKRFARPVVEASTAISKRMGWREGSNETGRSS